MTNSTTWTMRYLRTAAVLLTLIFGLTACDNGGSGQSAAAITAQPTDQSVVAGTTASFTVVATDATSYQWQSSTDSGATFVDVSGTSSASYTTAVTTLGDSGTQYRVVVTGASNSVTSSAVTLTVTTAPVAPGISVQPADQSITEGDNISFSVTATGTSLQYQWQLSTDGGSNFSDISGETGATLSLTALPLLDHANQYRVVISNITGNLTSNPAVLTVNQAPSAPAFTADPASLSVVAPDAATFTTTVTGFPTPTLQWQLDTGGGGNFVDITGATSSSYTTPATSIGDNGNLYRVVASNTSGDITSSSAALSVALPAAPSFTTQPADVTIIEGQNTQFTVVVTGTPTPTLQWQLSTNSGSTWSNINGETGTTFTVVAPALANNGRQFRAVATNSEGPVNSNAATLTVNAAPANNTWQTAGRIGPVAGSIYHPKIAFDSLGNAMAIWMQGNAGGSTRYELWANRYIAGSGWGTPQVIYAGVDFRVNWPQLGVDASGNAIVVWELLDDLYDTLPHIWSVSYSPSTGWGTAAGIDNDTGAYGSSSPKLSVASNGTAVAIWSQGNGTSVGNILMATGSTGSGWGSPALLATAAIGQVGGPDAVLNATGNGIATWSQLDGSNFTLRAALITGGTAGTAQAISTNTGSNYNPHIAVNAGGTAVAIWGQLNGSRFEITSNRYIPGTGWGAPTQVNNPGYPAFNQTPDPQIQLDDAGTATALWVESTGASSPKFWNQQTGTSWGSAGLISYSSANYRMAVNGAGQILGSRFSGQNLYASPTYLLTTPDWGAGDLLTTTGYTPMELAIDASGNGLAVWNQAESGGGYALWGSLYR
jgi:hypothetical protein